MMKSPVRASNLKQLATVFILSHVVFVSPVKVDAATTFSDVEDVQILVQSTKYAFNQNYDKAEKILKQYIEKHPEGPEGYFFLAATYFEYMNAFRDDSKASLFKKYAKLCTKKAKKYIKKDKNNATGYFYMGGIAGYKGLFKAREQKLISAFRQAVISKRNLEKALKLDPELYDSYFGLGTLYYFASKKHVEEGGLVGWIIKKFITNDKDMRGEAVAMINKAITHGRMTSELAYSTLMWIKMSEKDYITAYDMANNVIEKYPDDMHGYWVRARVEMINGNCEEATINLNTIMGLIENKNLPLSNFNVVQTGLLLAQTCMNIGNWERRKITKAIRNIRMSLVKYEKIVIEYQNARQVAKDWEIMLHDLERKSRRIRSL